MRMICSIADKQNYSLDQIIKKPGCNAHTCFVEVNRGRSTGETAPRPSLRPTKPNWCLSLICMPCICTGDVLHVYSTTAHTWMSVMSRDRPILQTNLYPCPQIPSAPIRVFSDIRMRESIVLYVF